MEGYHAVALLSELDVQVRGGGGAAERLHASCRHLGAMAEVEGGERRQAAQCSHSHVGYLVGAAEERQRGCSPLLVRPRLSPPSNRRG
jgi:hypothetical protein